MLVIFIEDLKGSKKLKQKITVSDTFEELLPTQEVGGKRFDVKVVLACWLTKG